MSNEAERITDIYDRHAETWDRERSRNLVERVWLDSFLSLVRPGGVVLDVGCGAAEPIGRYMMDAGHLVVGIDASPSMIAICRQRFPAGDWRVADMRALDLGQVFDGIVAWDSFFHLSREDQRRMLPLCANHATPKAALLFTSGPTDGVATGSYHGEPLHHASLDPQEYRTLLAQNQFEVVAHAIRDPHCGGHTVWLCRKINA